MYFNIIMTLQKCFHVPKIQSFRRIFVSYPGTFILNVLKTKLELF